MQGELVTDWPAGPESIDLRSILESENDGLIQTKQFANGEYLQFKAKVIWINKPTQFALVYQPENNPDPTECEYGIAIYCIDSVNDVKCAWHLEKFQVADCSASTLTLNRICKIFSNELARAIRTVERYERDRSFRAELMTRDGCCVITGELQQEVLDAAHIFEVRDNGSDSASNGILLRRDLHALFDSRMFKINSFDGKITAENNLSSDYYRTLLEAKKYIDSSTLERISKMLAKRQEVDDQKSY